MSSAAKPRLAGIRIDNPDPSHLGSSSSAWSSSLPRVSRALARGASRRADLDPEPLSGQLDNLVCIANLEHTKLDVKVLFRECCGHPMISQTVEYALRPWFTWQSARPRRGRRADRGGDAGPEGVSLEVLQGLARAGVVPFTAGDRRGDDLVKPPTALTILESVNAVEPIGRIRECPLG